MRSLALLFLLTGCSPPATEGFRAEIKLACEVEFSCHAVRLYIATGFGGPDIGFGWLNCHCLGAKVQPPVQEPT